MHSASSISDCRRLERLPAPRSRPATFRSVHIQEHGVVPLILSVPPRHVADDSLPAFVNMDVFYSHSLLSLTPVPIEGFQKRGVG